MRMTEDEAPTSTGSPWLKELYDLFAPVRQAFAESGMTEDEINAEIDAALREYRAERARDPERAKREWRDLVLSANLTPEQERRFLGNSADNAPD